jgi:hypothetical protein
LETRADERTPSNACRRARGSTRDGGRARPKKYRRREQAAKTSSRVGGRRGGDDEVPAASEKTEALEDSHVTSDERFVDALRSLRFPLLSPYSLSPVLSTT